MPSEAAARSKRGLVGLWFCPQPAGDRHTFTYCTQIACFRAVQFGMSRVLLLPFLFSGSWLSIDNLDVNGFMPPLAQAGIWGTPRWGSPADAALARLHLGLRL